MHIVYLASVWLHLLAAMAWVGGMIFIAAVVVPLKNPEVMQAGGRRFRVVGWIALATLVVTGTFNVLHRGYRLEHFMTGEVFAGAWGHALALKLSLVGVVLALTIGHDWLGSRSRRAAMITGQITFLLSLAIVAVAVTLVR